MKIPISSYQKLFNSFLLKDFPNISAIEVSKPVFPFSVVGGIRVNFYMKKPENDGSEIVDCRYTMYLVKERIEELIKYMTDEKVVVDMYFYYDGALICQDMINW